MYKVKLVGFSGSDKLSKHTPPHEKPAELGEWRPDGPVDEFWIGNMRRPVDFYNSSPPSLDPVLGKEKGCGEGEGGRKMGGEGEGNEDAGTHAAHQEPSNPKPKPNPHPIPGCTPWFLSYHSSSGKPPPTGTLYTCRALTVTRQPLIRFRASTSSASNGVSSTKIRRIMSEVPDGELLESFRDLVVSPEVLVG